MPSIVSRIISEYWKNKTSIGTIKYFQYFTGIIADMYTIDAILKVTNEMPAKNEYLALYIASIEKNIIVVSFNSVVDK